MLGRRRNLMCGAAKVDAGGCPLGWRSTAIATFHSSEYWWDIQKQL
jgi:hypothetical protein